MTEPPDALTFSQYLIGCVVMALVNIVTIIFNQRADAKKQIKVAKNTGKDDIEKTKMDWSHESSVSFAAEISDAITAATVYSLDRGNRQKRDDAIVKLNSVRVKATGNLATSLDNVYFDIDSDHVSSEAVIRKELADVIDRYREHSSKNATA